MNRPLHVALLIAGVIYLVIAVSKWTWQLQQAESAIRPDRTTGYHAPASRTPAEDGK
ncbi:MAG: hypothetical protein KGL39_27495 [Patescibacteria group bacterium]|nr:hypothetical protein [Patescibacteria group bacterium]